MGIGLVIGALVACFGFDCDSDFDVDGRDSLV